MDKNNNTQHHGCDYYLSYTQHSSISSYHHTLIYMQQSNSLCVRYFLPTYGIHTPRAITTALTSDREFWGPHAIQLILDDSTCCCICGDRKDNITYFLCLSVLASPFCACLCFSVVDCLYSILVFDVCGVGPHHVIHLMLDGNSI